MPAFLKLIIEFGPLLIFFIAYKIHDANLIIATKYLMAFSVLSVAITYYYEKKIPKPLLYSTIILLVCGSITVITNDPIFIKIKLTIIYLLFSIIIFGGLFANKIILKSIFGHTILLLDKAWIILSKRFGYLFVLIAILNEIIWRNFSESFWLNFKVFGVLPIMLIFIISQISFLNKNKQKSIINSNQDK